MRHFAPLALARRCVTKPLWLLTLVAVVCGCARQLEADISSDGERLAVASEQELSITDYKAGTLSILRAGEAFAPTWAPDGRSLAFVADGKLHLYDLASGNDVELPYKADAPVAWHSSGKLLVHELRGSASYAALLDPVSGNVVRRYRLSVSPRQFMQGKRDTEFIAVGATRMQIWRDGVARDVEVKGHLVAAGYAADGRAFWIETVRATDAGFMEKARMRMLDGDQPKIATVWSDVGAMLGSPGRLASIFEVAASPDGRRLAIAGVVDASPPGLQEEYMSLREGQHEQRRSELEKQIQLETVVAISDLDGTSGAAVHRSPFEAFGASLPSVKWARTGRRLLMVAGSSAKLLDVPSNASSMHMKHEGMQMSQNRQFPEQAHIRQHK